MPGTDPRSQENETIPARDPSSGAEASNRGGVFRTNPNVLGAWSATKNRHISGRIGARECEPSGACRLPRSAGCACRKVRVKKCPVMWHHFGTSHRCPPFGFLVGRLVDEGAVV